MAGTLSALAGSRIESGDASSGVAQSSLTLAVENMHCGGCMRKVEAALLALPGVVAARTNLSTRRVSVTTRSPQVSVEPLIAALEATGFKATALDAEQQRAGFDGNSDLVRRLGVAGFAAMNIMLLSVSVWSGHGGDMPGSLQTLFHWLSALIALPAIAYAGQPFFASARRALSAGQLNMDVPISLGVCLATAMSLFQTVRGSEQVYFDAATSLLFFLLIGRALDQHVRQRAMGAAENLLGLRSPMTSVLANDGTIERVPTTLVSPGTTFLVAAGERIPLDAILMQDGASVDESLISGESHPRQVMAGETLYAGTISLTGPHEARAIAAADNTLLADIARLMQSATQARGLYVRLADRAARLYAPAVHVLGLATFLGWMLAGYGWEPALTAAIAVLIITCPCALALAVPVVQVVACSRLFQSGIIMKAADGLERLADVDTVVFDKTGTLTVGEPRLIDDASISDATLATAASLAVQSRHPYSKALTKAAAARGLRIEPVPGVEEFNGAGLRAHIDGREIWLGSGRFCGLSNAAVDSASLWFRDGGSEPVAFHFEDRSRADAPAVVKELMARSLSVELLSGDRPAAVSPAAAATGIVAWRAAQRPDDKIRRLDELKSLGRKVLMVGDGLNDAPALAAAHASISPSTAADISQTASDAVFQGQNLAPVLEVLTVARCARRRALENFAIAIGYNMVFVPLAMAGHVTPLIAALAMSASSIAVTLNALRMGRSPGKTTP